MNFDPNRPPGAPPPPRSTAPLMMENYTGNTQNRLLNYGVAGSNHLPSGDANFSRNNSPMPPMGSPIRVPSSPMPLKANNPLEYPPYVQFSEWKNNASSYDYFIIVGDQFKFQVPYDSIRFHNDSLSFNFHWSNGPLQLRLPFKFSVIGQYSGENRSVGEKRNLNDPNDSSSQKKMKIGNSSMPDNFQKNSKILFSDNVIRTTEGHWADKGGKIIIISSNDNDPYVIKMHSVYFNMHGQQFLQEQKRVLPNHIRNDPNTGFKGYAVFVTIRDCIQNEILFEHQSLNEDISRVESPFRQTVSLQLVKKPILTNQSFLAGNEVITDKQVPRLVADITIFDCFQNTFFCRSSFMWIESHTPNVYYCAMLAPPTEYGYLNIQFKVTPNQTEIRSCSITLYLTKILAWFDKARFNGHKIPIVSKLLIDSTPTDDPLSIFGGQ